MLCYVNVAPLLQWHGMACLEITNMYNQNSTPPPMSPRISFSNDFVDSSTSRGPHSHHRSAYRDAPVSSDFEFSVTNYSMMSADELFCKGRLLPLKESGSRKTTTLREELEEEEDGGGGGGGGFSLRPPKNPTRWRGFLGLKKSHIGSKKSEKSVEKRSQDYVD